MAERKKKMTFGGTNYHAASPRVEDLGPETKVVNVRLSLEDALKLSLAVNEGVRYLNRTKRAVKDGRKSALNVAVQLSKGRIVVTKASIRAKRRRKAASEPAEASMESAS